MAPDRPTEQPGADLVDISGSEGPQSGTFRRQVAWTFAIQGTGAALAFLTVVWLGVALGPEQQGIFSRTKTEIEFLASFAAFGLPQALQYFVTSRRIALSRVFRIALATAGVGGFSAIVYAVIRAGNVNVAALPLALAVAGVVWQSILRTVLLSVSSSTRFNLVTALPQLLVFLLVCLAAGVLGSVNVSTTTLAFFLAFAAAGTLAYVWIVRAGRLTDVAANQPVRLRGLLTYGGASWLTAVCANLTILLCTLFVGDRLGGQALGVFTAGMVIAQMILTPLNYMLPLLFKRWMQHPNGIIVFRTAFGLAAVPLLAAGGVAFASAAAPATWLGGYHDLIGIAWIIILGVAAEVIVKLLTVAAYAQGRPWRATLAEVARVLTTLILLFTLRNDLGINGVASVWTASAFCAAGVLLVCTRFRIG